MSREKMSCRRLSTGLVCLAVLLAGWCLLPPEAPALPQGPQVAHGSATFQQNGGNLQITTSDRVIINYQGFSISASELVRFLQPGRGSAALNRVIGVAPSLIHGSLLANGNVFIINRNGILFGNGAQVNVGGLVASTLNITDQDFLAGRYTFSGTGGSVINEGSLTALAGGSISLIGSVVENRGSITAQLGSVNLASGSVVTLNVDDRGLIVAAVDEETQQSLGAENAVDNAGDISAEGGTVRLTGKAIDGIFNRLVNNSGTVQAAGVVERDGVIEFVGEGGDVINSGVVDASGLNGGAVVVRGNRVGHSGRISANAESGGSGGTVLVKSTGKTVLMPDSLIEAKGGGEVRINPPGPDGFTGEDADSATIMYPGAVIDTTGGADDGFVEVSGAVLKIDGGTIRAGRILFDPTDITFSNAADANVTGFDPVNDDYTEAFADDAGNDSVFEVDAGTGALLNVDAGESITFQAQNDINITAAFVLFTATGDVANVNLTLEANNDIDIDAGITMDLAGNLTLIADADGNGVGRIDNDSNSTITIGTGDLLLVAGSGVGSVGSPVLTSGADNIAASTSTGGIYISEATASNLVVTTLGTTSGLTAGAGNIDIAITGGTVTVSAPITASTGSVTIDPPTSITINADINADGGTTLDANDGITINANIRDTGGNIAIDGDKNADDTGDVTMAAGTSINAAAGSVTIDSEHVTLREVSASTTIVITADTAGGGAVGTTTLYGDVVGGGGVSITGAAFLDIDLAANVNISATDSAVNLQSGGTIDGGFDLHISAGSGAVTLGAVGGGTALGSLTVVNSGVVTLGGNIATTGNIDFIASTGVATITADRIITSSGGHIDLSGATRIARTAAGDDLDVGGATTLSVKLPQIGANAAPLGSVDVVSVNGATLTGDIFLDNDVSAGHLVVNGPTFLAADVGVDTDDGGAAGGGPITLGDVDGDGAAVRDLSLDTDNGAITVGAIGQEVGLDSLTFVTSGTLTFDGNASVATLVATGVTGPVIAGTDVVLTITTTATNVFNNASRIDGTTAGTDSLTINAATQALNLPVTGGTVALDDLTIINNTAAVTLSGDVSAAGDIDFSAATGGITISADRSIVSTGGNIDLSGSTIARTAGTDDLTVGGATTLTVRLPQVGTGGAPLGLLTVTSVNGTTLTGDINTDDPGAPSTGAVTISGPTFLGADLTINTDAAGGATGGPINLGAVDADGAAARTLTLDTADEAITVAAVGQTNALTSLTFVTSGTLTFNGNATTGTLVATGVTGPVIAGNDVTIAITTTATNVFANASRIDATTAGVEGLTINAADQALTLPVTGGTTALDFLTLSTTGTLSLAGNLTTVNDIDLSQVTGVVTITADRIITSSAGDIDLSGATRIARTAAGDDLDVGGATTLSVRLPQIGANAAPLGSVDVVSINGTTLTGGMFLDNDVSDGHLVINGPTFLATDVSVDTDDGAAGGGGPITLGDVDGDGAAVRDLVLDTADDSITVGTIGHEVGLDSLTFVTSGTLTFDGNASVATLVATGVTGPVIVGNDVLIAISTTATNVFANASRVDATTAGAESLTINALNAQDVTLPVTGGTTPLGGLTVTTTGAGTTTLNGFVTVNGNVDLSGTADVDLGAAVTVNTSGAHGNINLAGGAVDAGFALGLNAGAGDIDLDGLGQNTPLASLTVTSSGTVTLNDHISTDAGNVSFVNATQVDLAAGTTIIIDTELDNDAAAGDILFGNAAIDGAAPLTLDAGVTLATTAGNISLGNVGSNTALTSLTLDTDSGTSTDGTLTLNGDITTATLVATSLTGPVVLGDDVALTITTLATNVFDNTASINATAAGIQGLSINAADQALSLPVIGATALDYLTITTSGQVTFRGNVTTENDLDLSGTTGNIRYVDDRAFVSNSGNIDMSGTGSAIDPSAAGATQTLTITASSGAVSLVVIGGVNPAEAVTITSLNGTTLNGNITTDDLVGTGNVTINGGTILAGGATITIATSGGAVDLEEVDSDGQGNLENLTINTTNDAISIDAIGQSDKVGTLSITTSAALDLGGDITADTLTVTAATGAVTLSADVVITTTNSAVNFSGASGIDNGQNLTFNTGFGAVTLPVVGNGTALASLTVVSTGATTLGGGITTTGNVDFSLATNVDLGAAVTITSGAGNVFLTGGAVDGAQVLTIVTTSGNVELGPIGQGTALTGVDVDCTSGALTLQGDITVDGVVGIDFSGVVGNVVLGADVILTTTDDVITFSGRTVNGAQTLTINAGTGAGGAVTLGAVGNTTNLAGLTIDSNAGTFGGTISIDLGDIDIDVVGGITFNNVNVTTTGSGTIRLDANASNLVLGGAAGDADVDAVNGNITVIAAGVTLGVAAGADGRIRTTGTGNIEVEATGAVLLNDTTNDTTTIGSGGTLNIGDPTTVTVNAVGLSAGSHLTITASGAITNNTDITATGTGDITITSTAGNINQAGDITATGDTVTLSASTMITDTTTNATDIEAQDLIILSATTVGGAAVNAELDTSVDTFTANTGGTIDLLEANGITLSSITTSDDFVTVEATLGDIEVGTISAGGATVTLDSFAAAMTDDNGDSQITGATLNLDAATNIGADNFPINTTATSLTADATAGDIYIVETNNLTTTDLTAGGTGVINLTVGLGTTTLTDLDTNNGTITVEGAGALAVEDVATGTNNNIFIHTTSGDIDIATTGNPGVNAGSGDVTIDTDAGAIDDAEAADTTNADVTADEVTLRATTGIGATQDLETAVATLTAITDTGTIDINETATTLIIGGAGVSTKGSDVIISSPTAMTVNSPISAGGTAGLVNLDVTGTGALTVNASISTNIGNIELTTADGAVAINAGGDLTAGGDVDIDAGGTFAITISDAVTSTADDIEIDTADGAITLNVAGSLTAGLDITIAALGLLLVDANITIDGDITAGDQISVTASDAANTANILVGVAGTGAEITSTTGNDAIQAITLSAENGIALNGVLTAATSNITLTADSDGAGVGALTDSDTTDETERIVCNALTITAGSGIGVTGGGDIDIDVVAVATATTSTTGGIFLDEADDANVTGAVTVTAGTGVVNISADGTLNFAGAGDITTNDGSITVTADAESGDTGAITMANGTLFDSGDEAITLSAGTDIVLGQLATTGAVAVGVTSTAGAITDAGDTGGADVNAASATLTFTAATGVGTAADPIETTIATLVATTTAGGHIVVTETDALTSDGLTTLGSDIVISSGGTHLISTAISAGGAGDVDLDVTGAGDIVVSATVTTNDGHITMDTNNGNIDVNFAVTAGGSGDITLTADDDVLLDAQVSALEDTVTMTATTGEIDDTDNATETDYVAGHTVVLTASAGIGVSTSDIDTDADILDAHSTTAGNIVIVERTGVELRDVDTVDGDITITTNGDTTATDVVAGSVAVEDDDITITVNSVLTVGTITAANDTVTLDAENATNDGSIVDDLNQFTVITCLLLDMDADLNIGDSSALGDIDTTVTNLQAASAVDGGIWVRETAGGLNTQGVTTADGPISLDVTGALTVDSGTAITAADTTAGEQHSVTIVATGAVTVEDDAGAAGATVTADYNLSITSGAAVTIEDDATAAAAGVTAGNDLTIEGTSVAITNATATAGNVAVTATTGAITDGGATSTDITASAGSTTTLTADEHIGTAANPLDTTIDQLVATSTGTTTQDIYILETNGINLVDVTASGTGAVVNVQATAGAIEVGEVTATTTVTLNAALGAVTDADNDSEIIAPTSVVLTAGGGAIGATGLFAINTSTASLTGTATTGIYLVESDNLTATDLSAGSAGAAGIIELTVGSGTTTLTNLDTSDGTITVEGAGALVATDVQTGNDNNISIHTTGGAITLGVVTVNTLTNGDVTIDTDLGAIDDATANVDAVVDVTCDLLTLRATTGIGATADVDTAVVTLTAITDTGHIIIAEQTTTLTIGGAGVSTTGSNVTISSPTAMTVNSPITAGGTGKVDLDVTGTGALTVAASITTNIGNIELTTADGAVAINAGGDLTAGGGGDVDIDAGGTFAITISDAVTSTADDIEIDTADGAITLNVAGSLTAGLDITIAALGLLLVDANITIDGDITAGDQISVTASDAADTANVLVGVAGTGAELTSTTGDDSIQAITLSAENGIALNGVLTAATSNITLTADSDGDGTGALTDSDTTNETERIIGNALTITAGSGIGAAAAGADIDLEVVSLATATTTTNGIYLDEVDGMITTGVVSTAHTAAAGTILIDAAGNLVVQANVTVPNTGAGSITLRSTGDESDLDIEGAQIGVAAAQTMTGNITLQATHSVTMDATTVVRNTANITVNADTDADGGRMTMTDGAVIETLGAGNVTITVTAGGDVTIAQLLTNGTSGDVTITSRDGGVVDGGDSAVEVTADELAIDAEQDIGSSSNVLEVTVIELAARTTDGDVYITETNALIIGADADLSAGFTGVTTGGSDIVIISGADMTISSDVVAGAAGDISLTASTGNVNIDAAVTADEDTVTITATAAEIDDTDDTTDDLITGHFVNLTASTHIGVSGSPIDTNADILDASSTTAGTIYIVNHDTLNAIELQDVDTVSGDIDITTDSDTHARDVVAGTAGNVVITVNSVLTVGTITAVGDDVTLDSENASDDGSIVDDLDDSTDITCDVLIMDADRNIGNSADYADIDTDVTTIRRARSTISGGIWITENDATDDNLAITLTAAGDGITTTDGPIVLRAIGTTTNVTVSAAATPIDANDAGSDENHSTTVVATGSVTITDTGTVSADEDVTIQGTSVALTGVTADNGDVAVTATTGAITDNGDTNRDITATNATSTQKATLVADDNIGTSGNPLDTAIDILVARSDGTTTGGIYVGELNNLILGSTAGEEVKAINGAITISAGTVDVTAGTMTVEGNVETTGGNAITLTSAGNMTVASTQGEINAATTGAITLTAANTTVAATATATVTLGGPVTSGSGDIRVNANEGITLNSDTTTSGDVYLESDTDGDATATTSGITDAQNGTFDISANDLFIGVANAVGFIGTSAGTQNELDTDVDTITAHAVGPIYILEDNAVTLTDVDTTTSSTAPIHIRTIDGAMTTTDIDTNDSDVTLITDGPNDRNIIQSGDISTGAATRSTVILRASGAVTDTTDGSGGATFDITAQTLIIEWADSVGATVAANNLDTDVAILEIHSTGSVFVLEDDAIRLRDVDTTDGSITITNNDNAAGNMTMSSGDDVEAGGVGGDVALTTQMTSNDLALNGDITATNDAVTLTATGGITDTTDGDTDITSESLVATAVETIGATGSNNELDTDVETIEAHTTRTTANSPIYILEDDGVNLVDVDTAEGLIDVRTTDGTMEVAAVDAAAAATARTVTLHANGQNKNVVVNGHVVTENGNIEIDTEDGDIQVANTSAFIHAGTDAGASGGIELDANGQDGNVLIKGLVRTRAGNILATTEHGDVTVDNGTATIYAGGLDTTAGSGDVSIGVSGQDGDVLISGNVQTVNGDITIITTDGRVTVETISGQATAFISARGTSQHVTITAGGQESHVLISSYITTASGNITITTDDGDIKLLSTASYITAGGSGDISLTSGGYDRMISLQGTLNALADDVYLSALGPIRDDSDANTRINADRLFVTQADSIGDSGNIEWLETNVRVIEAHAEDDIWISELDAVLLSDVDTQMGRIEIVAGGTITVEDVDAGVAVAPGTVTARVHLKTTNGSILPQNGWNSPGVTAKYSTMLEALGRADSIIGRVPGAGGPLNVNIQGGDLTVRIQGVHAFYSVSGYLWGWVSPSDRVLIQTPPVPPGLVLFNNRLQGGGWPVDGVTMEFRRGQTQGDLTSRDILLGHYDAALRPWETHMLYSWRAWTPFLLTDEEWLLGPDAFIDDTLLGIRALPLVAPWSEE